MTALPRSAIETVSYTICFKTGFSIMDLDNTIYGILREASSIADDRNGFIEAEVIAQGGSERYW